MGWIVFAIGAMLLTACITLMFRKLSENGVSTFTIIFMFKAVAGICLILVLILGGEMFTLTLTQFGLLALLSIFSNLGDIGQIRALHCAPNPGYAAGVIFLYPLFVTVISTLIPSFKATLTPTNLIGVGLCIAGGLILSWPETKSTTASH